MSFIYLHSLTNNIITRLQISLGTAQTISLDMFNVEFACDNPEQLSKGVWWIMLEKKTFTKLITESLYFNQLILYLFHPFSSFYLKRGIRTKHVRKELILDEIYTKIDNDVFEIRLCEKWCRTDLLRHWSTSFGIWQLVS